MNQAFTRRAPTFAVGYDLSETSVQALEQALAYASLSPDTTIHIAWVPPVGAPLPNLPHAGSTEPMDVLKAEVTERVTRYKAQGIPIPDAQVELHVLSGPPDEALTKLAFTVDADLIFVGTEGRRGLERAILGSVAEKVVRGAPCPVLVARPKASQALPKIEAPPQSEDDTLNEQPHHYSSRGRDIQPHASFPLTVPM